MEFKVGDIVQLVQHLGGCKQVIIESVAPGGRYTSVNLSADPYKGLPTVYRLKANQIASKVGTYNLDGPLLTGGVAPAPHGVSLGNPSEYKFGFSGDPRGDLDGMLSGPGVDADNAAKMRYIRSLKAGDEIQLSYRRGKVENWTFEEYNNRAPKFPVNARNARGTAYKFKVAHVVVPAEKSKNIETSC